jgi:hypothetical protein
MKKKYEKPEVKKVPLKPEEAVLTACKTPGGGVSCRPGTPLGRMPGS